MMLIGTSPKGAAGTNLRRPRLVPVLLDFVHRPLSTMFAAVPPGSALAHPLAQNLIGDVAMRSPFACIARNSTSQPCSPAKSLASRKSTRAFGSSASCIMISDISTWSRKTCNPATTRTARGCHPCLRYDLSPMCPGWTKCFLAERMGFEPMIRL